MNINETIEKLVELKGKVELDYALEEQYTDECTIELLDYAITYLVKFIRE